MQTCRHDKTYQEQPEKKLEHWLHCASRNGAISCRKWTPFYLPLCPLWPLLAFSQTVNIHDHSLTLMTMHGSLAKWPTQPRSPQGSGSERKCSSETGLNQSWNCHRIAQEIYSSFSPVSFYVEPCATASCRMPAGEWHGSPILCISKECSWSLPT